MTKAQYERRLAELEAEADRRGCCVIPAKPLDPPAETPQRGEGKSRKSRKSQSSRRFGDGV